MVFLSNCFHQSALRFVLGTESFTIIDGSLGYSALCDFPGIFFAKQFEENFEFFPHFKISSEVFGYARWFVLACCFQFRKKYRLSLMCIPSGIFSHCKTDEILTTVSFCLFKKPHFLNVDHAPTRAVRGLLTLLRHFSKDFQTV